MANKKLRYFVRIDSTGRPVPGSNQNRSKKPVSNGTWDEFKIHDCCGPELTTIPGDLSGTDSTFTIACDAVTILTFIVSGSYANIYDLVGLLNQQAGYLGVFSVDGTSIVFKVNSQVSNSLCSDGTLTFEQV